MAARIDIVGQRFGRLLALSYAGRSIDGKATYLFKCDCEKEVVLRSYLVRKGKTTSCGCYFKEVISLPAGQAALNELFLEYKQSARQRNHLFSLTKKEFAALIKQECYYCGDSPRLRPHYGTEGITANGVDRVDNSIGYITSNVVTCCTHCNLAKRTMSSSDYLELIRKIYNKHWSGHVNP